jgi:hypothetical protein
MTILFVRLAVFHELGFEYLNSLRIKLFSTPTRLSENYLACRFM